MFTRLELQAVNSTSCGESSCCHEVEPPARSQMEARPRHEEDEQYQYQARADNPRTARRGHDRTWVERLASADTAP